MGLLAQVESSTFFILAVLVLSIVWLLWRSHRYLARQEKGSSPLARIARPQPPKQGPPMDAPDDVARWEVGMHETARDLCGQLDSKMGALSALVHEADRAAARLEAALEAAGQRPDQTGAPAPAAGRPSDSSSPLDPLPPQPANQAEALKSAGAADRLSVSRHVSQEAGKLRPSIDERYEEIYLLADYGFAAAEIARRVGSPVGEVELILGLRGKR